MSLQKKRMQTVCFRRKTASVRTDKAQYEETFSAVPVSIQPLSGIMAAQMYGEELSKTLLLLADPSVVIEEGMGVCVEVPAAEAPDYRVVYTARWSKHTVAHIQFIPPGKR